MFQIPGIHICQQATNPRGHSSWEVTIPGKLIFLGSYKSRNVTAPEKSHFTGSHISLAGTFLQKSHCPGSLILGCKSILCRPKDSMFHKYQLPEKSWAAKKGSHWPYGSAESRNSISRNREGSPGCTSGQLEEMSAWSLLEKPKLGPLSMGLRE